MLTIPPTGPPPGPSLTPLRPDLAGPFDVIGDVHGCITELRELLRELGYRSRPDDPAPAHPDGRMAVFVGDLGDRGPDSPAVFALVMEMVAAGSALCVQGNHDAKLARALAGRDVMRTHGLDVTMRQLANEPSEFVARLWHFVATLPSHLVLDGARLVVAHAGLRAELHGTDTRSTRAFALFGPTTGKIDEYGLPARIDWAAKYSGAPLVVYGHTPTRRPREINNTSCIDTGCVFGGSLTSLRYPERVYVSVAARREYWTPKRPIANNPSGIDAGTPED